MTAAVRVAQRGTGARRALARVARVARVAGVAGTLAVAACDPSTPTPGEPAATSHQVQVAIAGDGIGTVSVGATSLSCTTGGGACAAPVPGGTMVSLTATPAAGSTFSGWTGAAGCGTASTCAIRVDAPQTVTATFVRTAPATHALTIATAGTGAGSVASSPAGIACVRAAGGLQSGACEAPFTAAATVTLTATPSTGSTFAGWSGTGVIGCTGTGPCTVTVSAAQTVTATFAPSAPTTATLTVATGGAGSGTVTSAPAGIGCARAADGTQSGACAAPFTVGSAVTLTASATQGSAFVGWSGTGAAGCGGTGPCTVTIAEGRTVTATFAPPPPTTHALTVAFAGVGDGRVTSTPAGIQCTRTGGGQTGDCGTSVVAGTTVTLTATPSAGNVFAGWSGGGCSGTGPCTVTPQQATTVTATFAVPTPQVALTLTTAGAGGGTVTSSPAGISCTRTPAAQGGEQQTGACVALVDAGRTVTLTAAPVAGSSFQGWSGGCSGTGSCVLTVSAAQGVTATFALVAAPSTPGPAPLPTPSTFAVFAATAGVGSGSVASNPAGIACVRAGGGQSGSCAASFTVGTTVVLTATPAAGSTFAGWSGGCTGTGPCVLNATESVTATFTTAPAPVLTVTTGGTGSGSVSSAPAGIACTRSGGAQSGACAATYALGTTVTLTATADGGSVFAGWSGACSGTGTCTVQLSAAQTVTATFGPSLAQVPLTLTMFGTGGGTVTWGAPGASCTRTALTGGPSSICSLSYASGTTVTLTATPTTPGSYFSGWGGACFGLAPTCTLSMNAATSATASFTYDVSAPTLTVTGVADGAAYVVHPNITLAYADDMGFGATPLRITWSRRTPANELFCVVGLDFNNAPLFSVTPSSSCSARNIVGVGSLAGGHTLAGTYTLTIQSVDMAGNVSTPVTRTYTVGM